MDPLGVRWYETFRKGTQKSRGVLDDYTNEEVMRMKVLTTENVNGTYRYAVFPSHVSVYKFIIASKPSLRTFNERVGHSQLQKPRFDIDIDDSKPLLDGYSSKEQLCEFVKDKVIEGILNILDVDIARNILVYSSHGEEKASYHIIVDGFVHASCEDAAGFYDKVVPKEIAVYVDRSIYDRNHTLRMLWCHKRLNARVKTFNKSFAYQGSVITHIDDIVHKSEQHEQLAMLAASMITYSSGCKLLPSYAAPRNPDNYYSGFDPDRCSEVMTLLAKMFGDIYSIIAVSGSLINLERTRPHYCPLCNRKHDANKLPFITVHENNNVYWFCNRKDASGKRNKLLLGRLTPDISFIEQSACAMADMLESQIIQDNVSEQYTAQTIPQYISHIPEPTLHAQELPRTIHFMRTRESLRASKNAAKMVVPRRKK